MYGPSISSRWVSGTRCMTAWTTWSSTCGTALQGARKVYNLAADMGGMGFIENNKALCMLSVLINTHLLQASLEARVAAP